MIIRQKERQGKEVIAYTDKELKLLDSVIDGVWDVGIILSVINTMLGELWYVFPMIIAIAICVAVIYAVYHFLVKPCLVIVSRHFGLRQSDFGIIDAIGWRLGAWYEDQVSYFWRTYVACIVIIG